MKEGYGLTSAIMFWGASWSALIICTAPQDTPTLLLGHYIFAGVGCWSFGLYTGALWAKEKC